ncbi:putative esterase, partial [Salmonella enterica subsp. enterica serovar Baildon str. R6-199]
TEAYRDALLAHVIAGAGHWVHAEKPEAVLRAIRRYLHDKR